MKVKATQPGNTDMLVIHVSVKIHVLQYSSEFMSTVEGKHFCGQIMTANGVNGIHSVYGHEVCVKRSHVHTEQEILYSVASVIRSYMIGLGKMSPLERIEYVKG